MSKKVTESDAHATTDHDVIRKWTEERDGRPATVGETAEGEHAGILRIDFGDEDEGLSKSLGMSVFGSSTKASLPFFIKIVPRTVS
jgi:hypothetical protein